MIRRATVEDAVAIAVAHVRSWQTAYQGLIPQDFLDGLDPRQREGRWADLIAAADWPRSGTLVTEDGASVVGFAHLVPTRDDDADPAEIGEITSIYLLPDHWGAGLGRRLMSEALAVLSEAGYREVSLWVLDTNERAQRFYTAGGWRADGSVKVDTKLGIPLREVRYRRAL
jgi:ribosomal protein S18 acetylase RimI-like enzyme